MLVNFKIINDVCHMLYPSICILFKIVLCTFSLKESLNAAKILSRIALLHNDHIALN